MQRDQIFKFKKSQILKFSNSQWISCRIQASSIYLLTKRHLCPCMPMHAWFYSCSAWPDHKPTPQSEILIMFKISRLMNSLWTSIYGKNANVWHIYWLPLNPVTREELQAWYNTLTSITWKSVMNKSISIAYNDYQWLFIEIIKKISEETN